jgi:hypothetical protein
MRRSRFPFAGAILAVVALLGVIAVSGWHNTLVQDDDPVHAASIAHDHAPSKQADPDAPIHLLAHAMGQWVSTTGSFTIAVVMVLADRRWSARAAPFHGGVDPAELLRPPQE